MYFELCEAIWGGSPATTTIPSGIETTQLTVEEGSTSDQDFDPVVQDAVSVVPTSRADNPVSERESTDAITVKERRGLLNAQLKGHKQEKLKRKLPVDLQMLTVAKEDIQMKKQMFENMDNMDKEHLKHMENLTKNVGKLTESISQGFGLLRQVLVQPYAGLPQHLYSNTNNRQNMFSSPLSSVSNIAVTPPENNMQEASRKNFSFPRSLFSSHEDENTNPFL